MSNTSMEQTTRLHGTNTHGADSRESQAYQLEMLHVRSSVRGKSTQAAGGGGRGVRLDHEVGQPDVAVA